MTKQQTVRRTNMYKKLILIDLDGVLNTYKGNFDENVISPMREGAYEFLKELSKNYKINIFTARNADTAKQWLISNNLIDFVEEVTNIKSSFASIILDDRAINFNGDFKKSLEIIENFKPFWK